MTVIIFSNKINYTLVIINQFSFAATKNVTYEFMTYQLSQNTCFLVIGNYNPKGSRSRSASQ